MAVSVVLLGVSFQLEDWSVGCLQSKMVLQVHDELLIEAPESEVTIVAALLKKTMEKAILLDVPLKVDVKITQRWE